MTIQPTSSAPSAINAPQTSQHKHQAQQAEQKQDTVELSAQAKAALDKGHKGGKH